MVGAKHVSGKNILWSTLTVKSRGGKIFEFVHCPFEGRANMHHKIQPNWLTGRCCLAGGSKGQCRKSKIFLSLLLPMQVDQYIFFPETCFAPTISEPEFTVWLGHIFRNQWIPMTIFKQPNGADLECILRYFKFCVFYSCNLTPSGVRLVVNIHEVNHTNTIIDKKSQWLEIYSPICPLKSL